MYRTKKGYHSNMPNHDSSPVYPRIVVLTGSIGSGKSTAAAIFAELGAFVVSADNLAREVVEQNADARNKMRAAFGASIFDEDGKLLRSVLADSVFSDPQKRQKLEQIIHPEVANLAQDMFSLALAQGYSLIIYDVPLFYEAGLDKLPFRKVILITASERACIDRVVARDGVDPEQVQKRLAAQMSVEEKRARANIVIENSGTPGELREKIVQIVSTI
jgi:dephospho-CoA kinase